MPARRCRRVRRVNGPGVGAGAPRLGGFPPWAPAQHDTDKRSITDAVSTRRTCQRTPRARSATRKGQAVIDHGGARVTRSVYAYNYVAHDVASCDMTCRFPFGHDVCTGRVTRHDTPQTGRDKWDGVSYHIT